ncbi:MAG: hypothetical protein ABH971_00215 [bacterium]
MIIYQIFDKDSDDEFDFTKWGKPFEIGIGDPKDKKKSYTHLNIEQEIAKKLGKDIVAKIRGLLYLNENRELIIFLDFQGWKGKFTDNFLGGDCVFLKYFQEMLERYKIKEIYEAGEEKSKELFKRFEKNVWDTQTSAYAEKKGMTNTEFLRWQLEKLEKETKEEKEKRKEEKEDMEENF